MRHTDLRCEDIGSEERMKLTQKNNMLDRIIVTLHTIYYLLYKNGSKQSKIWPSKIGPLWWCGSP